MAQQQKILYGVFTIIIVLAVVCVAAVIFFLPSSPEVTVNDDTQDTANAAKTDTFDPSTWVQNGETVPEFNAQEPDDGIIVIGVEDAGKQPEKTAEQSEKAKPDAAVVSVPSARDIETPANPPRQTSVARSTSGASGSVPQSAPAKKTVRAVEYWIQAGSYTSRSRAENSQTELKKQGFSGVITTKEIGGVNHYRLRFGPYEDKNEADKFLGWIRGIKNYEGSYRSEVYVQKTL